MGNNKYRNIHSYYNQHGQEMTREAFHALQLAMRFNYCDYFQLMRYAKARGVSEPLLRLARQLVVADSFDKANSKNTNQELDFLNTQASNLSAFLQRNKDRETLSTYFDESRTRLRAGIDAELARRATLQS